MLKREFWSPTLRMCDRSCGRGFYLPFSSDLYRGKLGKEEINETWFALPQFSFDKTLLYSSVCILSVYDLSTVLCCRWN